MLLETALLFSVALPTVVAVGVEEPAIPLLVVRVVEKPAICVNTITQGRYDAFRENLAEIKK